jgi:ABC-type transport system involved in Fe-S cluster assembly fused permease/ATPase subunit
MRVTLTELTVRGAVAFDDVSFSYKPDVPVLKHVNLNAQPGQVRSRWLGQPGPVKPRSSICCHDSMTLMRDRSI